jgi:hypothetical protein
MQIIGGSISKAKQGLVRRESLEGGDKGKGHDLGNSILGTSSMYVGTMDRSKHGHVDLLWYCTQGRRFPQK